MDSGATSSATDAEGNGHSVFRCTNHVFALKDGEDHGKAQLRRLVCRSKREPGTNRTRRNVANRLSATSNFSITSWQWEGYHFYAYFCWKQ